MSKARELANLGNAYSDGALSNRNLIINGAMQVAQRGTSSTTQGFATIDRFKASSDGTMVAAVVTQSQASESPEGFPSSYKLTVNTAETVAPVDYYYMVHHIEAQNLQHLKFGLSGAESITLSFWVRSSVTGTYTVNLYRQDAARCFPKTYTVDSINTWEKKTIIIDGDTVGTIANDSGRGIDVYWILSAGGNYSSGTDGAWQTYVGANFAANHTADVIGTSSATWQITGVQLEVGDTATPFEHRSYGDELARCQRYFQILMSKGGDYHAQTMWVTNTAADSHSMALMFPHEMRAAPTGTLFGTPANVSGGSVGTSTWAIYGGNGWRGAYDLLISALSTASCRIDCRSNDGVTAGGAVGLYGGTDCYWELDAEL